MLKAMIRAGLPSRVLALSRAWRYRSAPIRSVFTRLYFEPNRHRGMISGPGSDLEQTAVIAREIPALLGELGVKTLLDAPCGDFYWMQHVELGVECYIGVDIVREQIERNRLLHAGKNREFFSLDVTSDPLPVADLILSRDLLVHLSFKDIESALSNFKLSMSGYLLTTTFPRTEINTDILTGDWRPINLQLPPFSFPRPLRLLNEHCTENGGKYADKSLGLWKLDDLLDWKHQEALKPDWV
jgi:hypothetical protein